jgi:hypothetical protein
MNLNKPAVQNVIAFSVLMTDRALDTEQTCETVAGMV